MTLCTVRVLTSPGSRRDRLKSLTAAGSKQQRCYSCTGVTVPKGAVKNVREAEGEGKGGLPSIDVSL